MVKRRSANRVALLCTTLLIFSLTAHGYGQRLSVKTDAAKVENKVDRSSDANFEVTRKIFDNSGSTEQIAAFRLSYSLGMGFPPGLARAGGFSHWAGFFVPQPIAPPPSLINGIVHYYGPDSLPVPEAIIELTFDEGTIRKDTTDSRGEFQFFEPPLPAILEPSKSGGFDRNIAITNADASKILFFLADSEDNDMSPAQRIASDVDLDRTITRQDADSIMAYAFEAEVDSTKNHTGEWRFLPERRRVESTPLSLEFTAILLGDNNCTWRPEHAISGFVAKSETDAPTHLNCIVKDSLVSVPVSFPAQTKFGSFSLQLSFGPEMLRYLGFDMSTGLRGSLWRERENSGTLAIAVACNRWLMADHDTLLLKFKIRSSQKAATEISFQKFRLDDTTYQWPSLLVQFQQAETYPATYALYPNFPNPFNPITAIRFDIPLPGSEQATLVIFDLHGRKVRTLWNGDAPPGRHTVRWDGCNEIGEPVATGVYFYRLHTKTFVRERKMLLLR